MEAKFKFSILGKTNLAVGRLGLADSYGAPAAAYEKTFEQGCNYFYSGSGRRRSEMKQADKKIFDLFHIRYNPDRRPCSPVCQGIFRIETLD
jgi:hypothetical protein